MAAPEAEGVRVMAGFQAEHGAFARSAAAASAAAAFGDASFSAGFDDPRLPPVRLRAACDGDGAALASPASSSSSDAFLSFSSTPSGTCESGNSAQCVVASGLREAAAPIPTPSRDDRELVALRILNPYGLRSPPRAPSEASSSEMDFGTARDYDTTDPFFCNNWLYEYPPFHENPDSDGGEGVDKFVVGHDASSWWSKTREYGDVGGRRHLHGDGNACSDRRAEVSTCSGCCYRERKNDGQLARDPCTAVYGRYQIRDDQTEVLDECVAEAFRFRLNADDDSELKGLPLFDFKKGEDEGSNLISLEKELQMLSPYLVDVQAVENPGHEHDCILNDKVDINMVMKEKIDGKVFMKSSYSVHPSPERGNAEHVYEVDDLRKADTGVQNFNTTKFQEVPEIDPELSKFQQEYEVFELKIFHRKNRTGFEENKEFPIVIDSVIAGRYRITEYLGSAAFSRVVRAHDLRTGFDVCLKIIKNDKDFFDQSLDEIKLLKYVNKYDPEDDHHILRLYDYFYYQEHLFIVTELLRANLYEFQKYNQESGDELYFSLPRIQSIARQCLEALVYLHHLNIVHCDLKPENILLKSYSRCEIKVIDLGSSCFLSDNLTLYVQSRSYRAPEVILGMPYDQKIDIWSLGCILAELYTGEVLFPNESVPIILARMIGTIGPIDSEMLALGQETRKYFTDENDLFHKNEETDQLEYLIPEKSSLRRHLQCPDSKFVDFLSYLLQLNPRKRPTASEALQHRWLSFAYP
ncbi:hypothetical protein ACP4OV_028807 [Aristida adscensionis]